MDPSRVRQLLFPASSSSEVDADLLSYLASFELEDHEQAVQDVDEICASACPAFAALPEAERTHRVVQFLSALSSGGGGDATTAAPTKQPTSVDPADAAAAAAAAALAAALKDLSTSSEKQDAPRRSTNSTAAAADDPSTAEDAATIDALADLIPVPDRASARQFAAHVLRDRCSGDADAAGEYLLSLADDDAGNENGRLAAAVQEHRRLARAREEEAAREALARERERQATLERFAWRPDSTSGGGGGGGPGGKPPPPEAKKRGSEGGDKGGSLPRVRYLDGVVVTTKGEKHVVVNQKEEWDGGSRGKVKTKGKRGVGFA